MKVTEHGLHWSNILELDCTVEPKYNVSSIPKRNLYLNSTEFK